jgi:hypothetical protein
MGMTNPGITNMGMTYVVFPIPEFVIPKFSYSHIPKCPTFDLKIIQVTCLFQS